MANGKIYAIRNDVNDLIYVGQTVRDVGERFKEHCHPGMAKRELLGKAIQEIGREHFYYEILEEGLETQRDMNYREAFYVSTMRTVWPDGYNLTTGGTWGKEFKNTKKPPRQDLIEAYLAGYSMSEVAEHFNVSAATVCHHLKKAGVEARPCGSAPGTSNRWEHTKKERRHIEDLS